MSEYRVDPDGVLGILAGLDDLEDDFETAHRGIENAADEGPTTLTVDGRKIMAKGWERFLEDRRLVPGKIMHAVNVAAQAISDATVEIIAGDEQMAGDIITAESYAESAWGIPPQDAYLTYGARP